MKKFAFILSIAMVLGFATLGNTDPLPLESRDGGKMYYDPNLNITWLADANYAKTSGYDADGVMIWSQAMAWAASLNIDGITGWRLPATIDGPFQWGDDGTTTGGRNITSSEMGYMFYTELGNKAFAEEGWSPIQNHGPFINLQPFIDSWEPSLWSSTVYSYAPVPYDVWYFNFYYGEQDYIANYYPGMMYAWAVRDGDVAVPEPASMLLLGLGLIGLAGARRRFKK